MKYIPHRKCIVCRKIQPKNNMLRVARLPDGTYQLDPDHLADGRGAYLCDHPDCIRQAISKKSLHHSFKTKVSEECYAALLKHLEESV